MNKKIIVFLILLNSLLFFGCSESKELQDTNSTDENFQDSNPNSPNPDSIECTNEKECDDKDVSTDDFCNEAENKCVHLKKTECLSGDKYCPLKCNYTTDKDCAKDLKRTCIDLGGFGCSVNKVCKKPFLNATDSSSCCPEECISKSNLTCEEQKGKLCDISTSYCSGEIIIASNTKTPFACCSEDCVQVIQEKTCSEKGGRLCNTKTASCDGALIKTLDTSKDNVCCSIPCTIKEIQKTCSELNGNICSNKQFCSSSWLNATDSFSCCSDICIQTDPCYGVNCESNQKCVNGSCVLKTCSELNGSFCETEQDCSVDFVASFDGSSCCTGSCDSSVVVDIVADSIEVNNAITLCSYQEVIVNYKLYNQVSINIKGELYDEQGLIDSQEDNLAGCISETDENGTYCKYWMTFYPETRLKGKNLTAVLDSDNSIEETDESNNEISVSVPPLAFDFTTKVLEYSSLHSRIGVAFDESLLTPENNYYRDPTYISFDLYVDLVKIESYTECVALSSYFDPEGRGYWIDYSLDPGTHELKVVWDPENLLSESDETNNTFTTNVEVT